MEGPSAVLTVVTYPPGAQDTQARIVIDGYRGAIFEYENGGPSGALVSSWAMSAGTDPYGNPYPEGFAGGEGSSFSGSDFIINNTGIFFYTGNLPTPLNANPYFTTGTGWVGYQGTFTVTGSPPAGAVYPYAGEYVNNDVHAGAMEESANPFAVTPGESYVVSCWVYSSVTSVQFGMDWLLNGTYISTSTETFTVTANTWTEITTAQTAPASGVNRGYARLGVPVANGATVYGQAITVYSSATALPDLYASITNSSGTDQYGNAYVDGVTIYHGTAQIEFHVNESVGAPAVELPTGVAMETGHASFYSYAPGSGGSQLIELYFQGPSGPDGNSTFMALASETESGSGLASGALGYNASALVGWDANGAWVKDTAGNPYDVARLSLVTANPLNQTISSTSPAVIGNVGQAMTAPVIADGSYELEAVIQWDANIAASTADFGFTGPALAQGWASALFMENNTGTTYVGMQTTGLAYFNSATMQVAQEMTTIINGYAQFSAAGQVSLVAKCGNAADSFVIINAKMTLRPMTQV